MSCQQRVAHHQKKQPFGYGRRPFKSWTRVCVATKAPASQHARAAAHSNDPLRARSTPVACHRWSPRGSCRYTSSGQTTGSGKRGRRSSSSGAAGSIVKTWAEQASVGEQQGKGCWAQAVAFARWPSASQATQTLARSSAHRSCAQQPESGLEATWARSGSRIRMARKLATQET